ncbi:hypothetical protein [Desulfobacter postgatei]|jgi:hypothetical protein|uniref:hypothetical protein n=1 Tax=Desulfobacter postgatei TaxID=2293 RepID=UPI002A37095C|nr:hypothetical protein [Desulfobacter postgatei]MDX9964099.1 hypothetical protein [Desulfobacter postgatei]
MRKFNLAIFLVLMAILTGCAGGRNYDYTAISIDQHLEGNKEKIAIGVHDQREYVKNGDKYPQYVGTQRSPAYVPWNINTKSGSPMADDFLQNISKSLNNSGYKVDQISLPEKVNTNQALTQLKATGDNRLLLFTINEWFFDVWYKTRMSYSMKLEVFDNVGRLLASSEVEKKMWDDKDNAVPDLEFKSAVEILLTNDSIVKGLNQNLSYSDYRTNSKDIKNEAMRKDVLAENQTESPNDKTNCQKSTEIKKKCTTDQVLKMKEMGMADEQIKAACQ